MSDLNNVAEKFREEIGLRRKASKRIARKLEALSKSVSWAMPLALQEQVKTTLEEEKRRVEDTEKILAEALTINKARKQAAEKLGNQIIAAQKTPKIEAFRKALMNSAKIDDERSEKARIAFLKGLSASRAREQALEKLEIQPTSGKNKTAFPEFYRALLQASKADAARSEAMQTAFHKAQIAAKAREKALKQLEVRLPSERSAPALQTFYEALSRANKADSERSDAVRAALISASLANKARETALESLEEHKKDVQKAATLQALRNILVHAATADKNSAEAANRISKDAEKTSKVYRHTLNLLNEAFQRSKHTELQKKLVKAR